MKGVILTAGRGSRLYPLTYGVAKAMLPIYDKPMILYAVDLLKNLGIRDICLVVNKEFKGSFKMLLGNGSKFGVKLNYVVQDIPRGNAEALLLCEGYCRGENVCLMFGDNIFYFEDKEKSIKKILNCVKENKGALIVSKRVSYPQNFGVLECCGDIVVDLKEKPKESNSNLVSTGLFFYQSDVFDLLRDVKVSKRGELENVWVLDKYIKEGRCSKVECEGLNWFDAGRAEDLFKASEFIREIKLKTGRDIF